MNFKVENNFLNIVSLLDHFYKSKSDIKNKNWNLILLYEEKLELLLIKAFKDSKKEVLNKLSLLDKYITKKFIQKNLAELNNILLDPRYKFTQVGQTRFKEFTFSVEMRNWIEKSGFKDDLNSIISINPDPFKEALTDAQLKSLQAGGQSVFNIFDLGIDFALRDKTVENFYENFSIKLSEQVAKELQSKIKFEILDGIKNAESIPKIRNRILSVYDKPINIVVKPKLDAKGKLVRKGYQYDMSPQHWATTTSRTEVMTAYNQGRLIGYEQSGVVEKVEYSVSADERLCPICAPFEGTIFALKDADGVIPQHPNCLTNPNSPVYTIDGWKKIVDVKLGELVLTHKKRFKKTIQLHRNKYTGKVVKLFFGEKRTLDKKSITITANHPLMINGKWIEAEKCKIDDNAKILVHKCKNCNNKIIKMTNNHSGKYEFKNIKITDIKISNRSVPTYNLSVEDDESYVYNGIVVHNCRCQWIPIIKTNFKEAKKQASENVKDLYNLNLKPTPIETDLQ